MCVKKCFAQVVFGRFFDGHSDVPSTLIARTHDGTLDVSYEGLLSVPSDRHIQVPMSLPKCKELRSDRHSKRPTDVCTSKTHRAFSTRMCTDVTSGCTLPTSITVFRYTLLLHTVPPPQMIPFTLRFDEAVRKCFSSLLLFDVPKDLWRACTGRPQKGGLGIPTGRDLEGPYFLMCLALNRGAIEKHAPSFDLQAWVDRYCAPTIRDRYPGNVAQAMVESVKTGGYVTDSIVTEGYRRSILQIARDSCSSRFFEDLPVKRRQVLQCVCFSGTHWVSVPPLRFMGWRIAKDFWRTAMRLRLGVIILARRRFCPDCSATV